MKIESNQDSLDAPRLSGSKSALESARRSSNAEPVQRTITEAKKVSMQAESQHSRRPSSMKSNRPVSAKSKQLEDSVEIKLKMTDMSRDGARSKASKHGKSIKSNKPHSLKKEISSTLVKLEQLREATEDRMNQLQDQVKNLNSKMIYLNEIVKPHVQLAIQQQIKEFRSMKLHITEANEQFYRDYFGPNFD